jgi:hypothetical protein
VPIVAGSFNGSSADMPCCKTKGKCCCRSRRASHANSGSVIAAAACPDCENGALGSVSAAGHKAIQLQVLTPAISVAGNVPIATAFPASRVFACSLRQRPPPPNPLA